MFHVAIRNGHVPTAKQSHKGNTSLPGALFHGVEIRHPRSVLAIHSGTCWAAPFRVAWITPPSRPTAEPLGGYLWGYEGGETPVNCDNYARLRNVFDGRVNHRQGLYQP